MSSVERTTRSARRSDVVLAAAISAGLHTLLLAVAAFADGPRTRPHQAGPVVIEVRSGGGMGELESRRLESGATTSGTAASVAPRRRHPRTRRLSAPIVPPAVQPSGSEPTSLASGAPDSVGEGEETAASGVGPVAAISAPHIGEGGVGPSALPSHPRVERQAARPIVNPRPVYPRQARLAGWEGTVVVRMLIDVEGKPTEISVIASSGHKLLDDSAVDAAKRWRFVPASEGGRPTAMVHEVRIRFRLDEAIG